MKAFLSLSWLLVRTTYGISFPRGKTRVDAKTVAKTVGIALLFLYMIASFGAIFLAMSVAQYEALKPLGLQAMVLLNAALVATAATFVFGLLTALSTYWSGGAEEQLNALPIGPRARLGAKFVVTWVSEIALSVLLMGIALGVYGFHERPSPAFYLQGALIAAGLPLGPLALCYLVLVPLLRLGRPFRNKNVLTVAVGLAALLLAVGFNILNQRVMSRLRDVEWIVANLGDPDSIVARLSAAWPPVALGLESLTAPFGPASVLRSLASVAVGAAAAVIVTLLLGPAYVHSLAGFGETAWKRLSRADDFIDRRFAARPSFAALFGREFVLMNREPSYFLNGPLVVVFMPVLMAIMFVAQRAAFAEEFARLAPILGGPYGMLVVAGAAAFLGSMTSIACTSVSRDAKMLAALKALPVKPEEYFLAKLAHALVFALLGALFAGVPLAFAIKLPFPKAALGVATGLSLSTFVNVAGLYLDMAAPRLRWENPLAALKQNPNSVVVVLGSMALLGGLGFLSTRLPLDAAGMAALFGGVPALLSAAALAFLPVFSRKRFAAIEP